MSDDPWGFSSSEPPRGAGRKVGQGRTGPAPTATPRGAVPAAASPGVGPAQAALSGVSPARASSQRAVPSGASPSGELSRPVAPAAGGGHVRWAPRDTWMALLGALLCFGGFAGLGWAVRSGTQFGFDRALLLSLRRPDDLSDPIGPGWLEEVARDVTALGSHVILVAVTLAVIGGLLLNNRRRLAVLTALAVGSGLAASALLKHGFERARPDLVPHAVEVYTASFPSGHAMLSALTWLTLAGLVARAQEHRRSRVYVIALAMLVTALVGASRIYLGVHWPTDVLAGWCMGIGWALLWALIARRLQRQGAVEPVRDLP